MLTKEQEKFLKDNQDIFEPLLDIKKKLYELEDNKNIEVDKYGKLHRQKKEIDKETVEKKKKIEHVLNKLSRRDVDRFISIFDNTKSDLLDDFETKE